MRRTILAAALLLLLVIPALGQGVHVTVTPTDAAFGQPIGLTLVNGTQRKLYFGSSIVVKDSGGRTIFSPPGGPPGRYLAPGQRLYQTWCQEDNYAKQVAPGHYTLFYGYGFDPWKLTALKQPVVVRDAKISWTGSTSRGSRLYVHLDAPQARGLAYRTLLSFDDSWGVKLPGGRLLPLVPDALFFLSVDNATIFFHRFAGTADAAGKATCWIDLPRNPVFRGAGFHAAYVMLSPQAPGGIHSLTNSLAFTIR